MPTTRELLLEADSRMKKAHAVLERELASIRTGRASPALVEKVRVEYYGVPTPLDQLATITAPEARLLLIQPWDRASLVSIEKALLKSDLGLTPASDGHVLRLAIPALTEERRNELVKIVKKRVEEGRVALRNIRRDILEELRKLEKEGSISQDDSKRAQTELQNVTDRYLENMNRLGETKEKEVWEG
jgi:ribosome recycling factor